MSRSKKQEKPKSNTIPGVSKYWFIDFINKKAKHMRAYKKRLISFNIDTHCAVDEDNTVIRLYTTLKEANIALYLHKIEEMRVSWKNHVDESMKMNDDISKMLDKLDKLRGD
jgi:hypothetical protein